MSCLVNDDHDTDFGYPRMSWGGQRPAGRIGDQSLTRGTFGCVDATSTMAHLRSCVAFIRPESRYGVVSPCTSKPALRMLRRHAGQTGRPIYPLCLLREEGCSYLGAVEKVVGGTAAASASQRSLGTLDRHARPRTPLPNGLHRLGLSQSVQSDLGESPDRCSCWVDTVASEPAKILWVPCRATKRRYRTGCPLLLL